MKYDKRDAMKYCDEQKHTVYAADVSLGENNVYWPSYVYGVVKCM